MLQRFDQKSQDDAQKAHHKTVKDLVKSQEEAKKNEPIPAPPSIALAPVNSDSRVSIKIGGKEQVKHLEPGVPDTSASKPAEEVKEEAAKKAGLPYTTAVPKSAATTAELKGKKKK